MLHVVILSESGIGHQMCFLAQRNIQRQLICGEWDVFSMRWRVVDRCSRAQQLKMNYI